jgi:hypothetical protein
MQARQPQSRRGRWSWRKLSRIENRAKPKIFSAAASAHRSQGDLRLGETRNRRLTAKQRIGSAKTSDRLLNRGIAFA